jgi:hypothetical protein
MFERVLLSVRVSGCTRRRRAFVRMIDTLIENDDASDDNIRVFFTSSFSGFCMHAHLTSLKSAHYTHTDTYLCENKSSKSDHKTREFTSSLY